MSVFVSVSCIFVCVCVWSHACICMCVCLHIGACPSAFELVHGLSYVIARVCVRVGVCGAMHAYVTVPVEGGVSRLRADHWLN